MAFRRVSWCRGAFAPGVVPWTLLTALLLCGAWATPAEADAPEVSKVERKNPSTSPTNSNTVEWGFEFDQDVVNVTADDFTVTGTGLGTVTLTVDDAGDSSDATYDVNASGGFDDLNATITLSIVSTQDIEDTGGDAMTDTSIPAGNDETYVIDNTRPRVASIERQTPSSSPTNADSVEWRVTFDENVTGVAAGDFEVTSDSTLGSVTLTWDDAGDSDDKTHDITVSSGNLASLNDTVTLGFKSGYSIDDDAGNAMNNTTPTGNNNNTFVIDNAGPRADKIERQSTHTNGYTNANSVEWRVTFDEDVTGVAAGDFEVTSDSALGSVTLAWDNAGDSDDKTHDITASGGNLASLNDTVTLGFKSGYSINDSVGNAMTNTTRTGTDDNTFEIDNTRPRASTITRQTANTNGATNSDSLEWRVTFNENMKDVDSGDFEVTSDSALGSVSIAVDNAGDSDDKTFDVTASSGNLAGLNDTVTLEFKSGYTVNDSDE